MMKITKRTLILVVLGLLCLGMAGSAIVSAKSVYPLKTNVTLTWWMELHSNVSLVVKNFGDTEFAKELQKRMGVKIKFIHPAVGNALEAFNLMLVSGDLPDIIEYKWFGVSGGPTAAYQNKQILKLNPIFKKYAPNVTHYLKTHPQYSKMVMTDQGDYFVFPFIKIDDPNFCATRGPLIRKDWLDELGLAVPETVDEWYLVLKAFKEKKGCSIPLTLRYEYLSDFLAGGYNNYGGFYVEKGKVKYGPVEPRRKPYFEAMHKWYVEGLLDKNFNTNAVKNVDSNMLNGLSGATFGQAGSILGRYLDLMKGKNFDLVAAPYPGPKKGQKSRFASLSVPAGDPGNQGNAAITTKCKNVEVAARVLDYAYSPEGNLFYNFGINGQTYKMINGYPTYTDLIMHNPEKLSNTQVMSRYMRGHVNGPFAQDKRYLEQYYELPQQKKASALWSKTDFPKYRMPPLSPSVQENAELATLLNDINTYADEMTLKFIVGVETLDKFPQFVAQLNKMGLPRVLEIYQAAYSRYLKRK